MVGTRDVGCGVAAQVTTATEGHGRRLHCLKSSPQDCKRADGLQMTGRHNEYHDTCIPKYSRHDFLSRTIFKAAAETAIEMLDAQDCPPQAFKPDSH